MFGKQKRREIARDKFAPIKAFPGDTVLFTVTEGGVVKFVRAKTVDRQMTLDTAVAFEVENDFGLSHGYGLVTGEEA